MEYLYKGKKVEEDDLDDIILEQMTDSVFEDLLNEIYAPIEIIGISYGVGTLLKRADYVYFKELRYSECDFLSREVKVDEDVANSWHIEWVEEDARGDASE